MRRACAQDPRQAQHVICMLVADEHSCEPRHLYRSTARPRCLWTQITVHRLRLIGQLAAIPAAVTCSFGGAGGGGDQS